MKANEIRIGNWVVFNTNNRPFQITAAGILDLFTYEDKQMPYNYQPILLTDEWVDKLSESEFEFAGFGTRIIYQSIKFPALKYEFTHNKIAVYFNDEMINIVSYIHEWQNIHHALTREELEITQ